MKNSNLFYLFLIIIPTMYGMENPLSLTEEVDYNFLNHLNYLKTNPTYFKKYKPLIEDIEAKIWSNIDNKSDIIDYTLQMINREHIETIIFTINEGKLKLKSKINILKELYKLPHPNIFEKIDYNTISTEFTDILEKNKTEYIYWINSKEKIKENIHIKYKEYNYEKQMKMLDNKSKRHQKISLEEWKRYYLSLLEYNKVVDSIVKKQKIKGLIKHTQHIIAIEETENSLKQMVCNIRQFKTADIQELSEYKITLEKYISLFDDNFNEKPAYLATMQLVSQRIKLLTEIDHELPLDYSYCSHKELENLSIYLKKLQNQLNKPTSERHIRLDEKIKYIESLKTSLFSHLLTY